jgi:hypothetical protein
VANDANVGEVRYNDGTRKRSATEVQNGTFEALNVESRRKSAFVFLYEVLKLK